MTTYQPGDLVLVAFPYAGGSQAKQRPALIVLGTGDLDVVVARVTTQPYRTPYDVAVSDWRGAGRAAPSIVRLHKLATLERALIRRRLGHLRPVNRQRIASMLGQMFGAW